MPKDHDRRGVSDLRRAGIGLLLAKGNPLRVVAIGAARVGVRVVLAEFLEPAGYRNAVHRDQLVAYLEVHSTPYTGFDEIDQRLAVVKIYLEAEVGGEIGIHEEFRVRVNQTGDIRGADLIEADVVLGGIDLGEPGLDLEHVEVHHVALPDVGSVLLVEQSNESLEICQLLVRLQLGECRTRQGCEHQRQDQEFHVVGSGYQKLQEVSFGLSAPAALAGRAASKPPLTRSGLARSIARC